MYDYYACTYLGSRRLCNIKTRRTVQMGRIESLNVTQWDFMYLLCLESFGMVYVCFNAEKKFPAFF